MSARLSILKLIDGIYGRTWIWLGLSGFGRDLRDNLGGAGHVSTSPLRERFRRTVQCGLLVPRSNRQYLWIKIFYAASSVVVFVGAFDEFAVSNRRRLGQARPGGVR